MQYPFRYTQLFKKEGIPEDVDTSTYSIDTYYDKYRATIDLAEVANICANFLDPNRATTVLTKSGTHLTMLLPVVKLEEALDKMHVELDYNNLLNRTG